MAANMVTAKRVGWDEELSDEQLLDLDPCEHDDYDLRGELKVVEGRVPGVGIIKVYLVGGQEADPATIEDDLSANVFCPTGKGGGIRADCSGKGLTSGIEKQALSTTPSEKDAILKYSEGGWFGINGILRGAAGLKMDEAKSEQISLMDSAISKTSLPHDTTVYRGIFNKVMKSWKEGMIIADDAFMSTSLDRDNLDKFNKKKMTELEIKLPKGHPALFVDALIPDERAKLAREQGGGPGTEKELLLPRGVKLKITSVKFSSEGDKERMRITAEVSDPQIHNAFCPTGKGNGPDNSCGKSSSTGEQQTFSIDADHHAVAPGWDNPPADLKKRRYGGVVFSQSSGLFLLREPAGHYDGYHWTFAKGGLDHAEENPAEAALREMREETGHKGHILGYVPGEHKTDPQHYVDKQGNPQVYRGSSNYYFLMTTKGKKGPPDHETASTRWVSYDDAKKLISKSTNESGRKRDLGTLDAAWREIKKQGLVENAFCPTGKGRGKDNSCPPHQISGEIEIGNKKIKLGKVIVQKVKIWKATTKLPNLPKFISSDKKNVEANNKAAKEMLELAKQGDIEGLKNHPGTPSPKLQAYKGALVKAVASKTPAKLVEDPSDLVEDKPAVTSALKDHLNDVLKSSGLTAAQVKGMAHDMGTRAKLTEAALKNPRQNAVLGVEIGDSARVASIAVGSKEGALKEFAGIPKYDLAALNKITANNFEMPGEALANMAHRTIEVGTSTRPGSYRHELGHVLHGALAGSNWSDKNDITKAISAEYGEVMTKVKKDPAGLKTKQGHEWYEIHYGVVGRRCLDNEEENFAEHYRVYHREIFRDEHEGGNGKFLAQYRSRHPGMARIFDAHYTTALIHQHIDDLGK